VWHARFEAIVNRFGLTQEEKLDQLLPKIEGKAAEFVFMQLPPFVLSSYERLVRELGCRFRVIETARSFAAKFARRSQRPGESVEEFAQDLQFLYDKAHGYRDRRTREEDLVRRFLDGLRDDEIRFMVEFNKEPETINEAIFHVVNLIQMRGQRDHDRWGRENTRRLEMQMEADLRMDETERFEPCRRSTEECDKGRPESSDEVGNNDLKMVLDGILQRLDKIEGAGNSADGGRRSGTRHDRREIKCYHCHELGHYARDCPKGTDQGRTVRGVHFETEHRERDREPLNYRGPSLAARERSN
jgi:hypothetical protein